MKSNVPAIFCPTCFKSCWPLQGACGGDLLFTEACQQREVKVQWLRPFDEPTFIQKSVMCRGEDWHGRYLSVKVKLTTEIHSAPEQLAQFPRARAPTNAARCGCSIPRLRMAYAGSRSSVCGTAVEGTVPATPPICLIMMKSGKELAK